MLWTTMGHHGAMVMVILIICVDHGGGLTVSAPTLPLWARAHRGFICA